MSSIYDNSWWQNLSLSNSWKFGKYPFAIGQLKNWNQIWNFSNDHDRFEFQEGLLYCYGFLYILDGPIQLQVLEDMYDTLVAHYFRFNKTMELIFENQ
jgi:hypothetical protein